MCGSPKVPQAPVQAVAPVPVRADQAQDLSPELVKANEQDLNIKKKKIKKSGTSSLNTSSGLNIATSTSP